MFFFLSVVNAAEIRAFVEGGRDGGARRAEVGRDATGNLGATYFYA